MNIDFHYYCVSVLARAAGFGIADALTMAYASQYVDDSTESEPFEIDGLRFDPVRTAHIGLEAFDWAVQKRVYIPFHFLPPKPLLDPSDTYLTKKNSAFANRLLAEATKHRKKTLRLCAIGIALHTFADSWAHHGFSGRLHEENDVESIWKRKGNRFGKLSWQNICWDLLPKVGHTQVGTIPDCSWIEWKCDRPGLASASGQRPTMQRSNLSIFLQAAQATYRFLAGLPNTACLLSWRRLKPRLRNVLEIPQPTNKGRLEKWQAAFRDLFPGNSLREYDPHRWAQDALGENVTWDIHGHTASLSVTGAPNFRETPWAQFHRAALLQRHFVLENLYWA